MLCEKIEGFINFGWISLKDSSTKWTIFFFSFDHFIGTKETAFMLILANDHPTPIFAIAVVFVTNWAIFLLIFHQSYVYVNKYL